MLFGVKAEDPATLIGAALLLLTVTALAALLPALRALVCNQCKHFGVNKTVASDE